MAFCLIPKYADDFIKRLQGGEIDPEKLNGMTSQERREFFASFMGHENATATNALFESKLLLKNQQAGFVSWAKQISGLKPEAQRDLISRVAKMDRVLNPAEQKAFMEDLAAQKLGLGVSGEEAAHISKLAKDVEEAKQSAISGGDRMAYGRAKVEFIKYMSDLKDEAGKMTLQEIKASPGKALIKGISNLGGLSKSLKASLDNSSLGRQGLKTLFSHPSIWKENAVKSFKDIARTFGGKEVMDEVRADVYSRPNALNGLYKKEGLAVGVNEEAYPTSLPEKIPYLGKAFKASDAAFSAFSLRTRADLFDKYVDIANKTGGDIKGLGKLVNSLTGRGNVGSLERVSNTVNNVFFSPRFLKSNIDLLTAHAFDKDMSPFARKQAAINTLKVVGGIAGVLALSNAVAPGSVEWDPRSSNFGKIKVGDTRFDVSGGMSSLVTLASRLLTRSTKSSITGKVSDLNTGKFASKSSGDVVVDFMANKLAPAASVARDLMNGRDRQGDPITFGGEASNLLMPLPITNYQELSKDPNSANTLAAVLADALGVGTNTYSKPVKTISKENNK